MTKLGDMMGLEKWVELLIMLLYNWANRWGYRFMEPGDLIVFLLFASIAVSVSVIPIVVIVLILLSKNSVKKGLGYLLGWVVGLVLLTTASYLLINDVINFSDNPDTIAVLIVNLLMGVVFLFISRKMWRSRPKKGETMPKSKIFDKIDHLSFFGAASLGFTLQIVNVKNIALVFIATMTLVKLDITDNVQLLLLILFIFFSSITIIAPLLFNVFMGERIKPTLARLKDWLLFNNKAVLAVMMFVTGLLMVVENLLKILKFG